MKSPHILLLMADQFRHDSYGSSPSSSFPESSRPSTPNLDALGASGVRLSNLYSSTPTCTPSRAGLLTGKSPWNHGMLGYDEGTNCQKYTATLAGELSSANYSTHVIGKDHFGTSSDGSPVTQGYQNLLLYDGLTEEFDDYDQFFADVVGPDVNPLQSGNLTWNCWNGTSYDFAEEVHPTRWTADQAAKVIDEFDFDGDESLFLKVSFHRPHSPYDPPQRLFDKYNSPDFDIPERILCQEDEKEEECWELKYYANYTSDDGASAPPEMMNGDPGASASRLARASYFGSIEFVDEGVGIVLDELKGKGVYDDMVVIFISDHGDMNGDHYMWRKGYPYDGASKVPGMIKWPASIEDDVKFDKGSVMNQVVELRDVAPTIWDFAGIIDDVMSKDPMIDGKSMIPLLVDKDAKLRDHIDLEHNQGNGGPMHFNAVTDGVTKFVFYPDDGRELLFHLDVDPDERFDVSKRPEEKDALDQWRQKMIERFQKDGRGEQWVKDGQLVKRGSIPHSPNFPCQ